MQESSGIKLLCCAVAGKAAGRVTARWYGQELSGKNLALITPGLVRWKQFTGGCCVKPIPQTGLLFATVQLYALRLKRVQIAFQLAVLCVALHRHRRHFACNLCRMCFAVQILVISILIGSQFF